MSLSKRIKWTKTAPILLLVCLATCSLTIGAKSRDSLLISKADYVTTQEVTDSVRPAAWTIVDNYSLSCRVGIVPWWTNPQPYSQIVTAVTFTGTTTQNLELEFAVDTYVYNTDTKLTETDFYPSNTKLSVYSKRTYSNSPQSDYSTFKFTIRRKDGGILTPSDMEDANITLYYQVDWVIEETTAIPRSWLDTSTASVPTIIDTSTTVVQIPSEYQSIDTQTVNDYMTLPARVISFTSYALSVMGRLLSLKYITPMLCFGLLVALAGWLFH